MCVVGATTATRATRPSESIRWATWRPNVVLPAAGVAEARKASPSWANTAAAAACCQARRGRPAGQAASAPRTGEAMGCIREAGRLPGHPDEPKGDSPLYVGWVAGRVPIAERGPGWTYRPDMRPPTVYGLHQPGIATPQMEEIAVAAFDLEGDLAPRLREWTAIAEDVMRGGGGTVTIGLGAGAIPPEKRPAGLKELPAFKGDALDPGQCGGDLCVLAPPEAIGRFGRP